MADRVQYAMELMVPELEDYREKGYFTDEEIRTIVKRRSDFEYRIRRMPPDRVDFERYIEYETMLEKLRKKRKTKLGYTSATWSLSDISAPKRIDAIYDALLRRFPGDVHTWARYFAFCTKNKAMRRLSLAHAKALQYHPRKPALWVMAARFEFESRANMVTARELMQRALRLNSDSLDLWIEYIKLELMYQQKLIDRRRVLGLPVRQVKDPSLVDLEAAQIAEATAPRDDDDDDDDDGNDDGYESEPSSDADVEDAVGASGANGGGNNSNNKDDEEAIDVNLSLLASAIPRAIFRSAKAQFPDSLQLHLRVLNLYARFDNTGLAMDDVYESMAESYAADPEHPAFAGAVNALSRRPMQAFLAPHAALKVSTFDALGFEAAYRAMEARYQEFLSVAPAPALIEAYLNTLASLVELVSAHGGVMAFTIMGRALHVAQGAAAAELLTFPAAAQWVRMRACVPDDMVSPDTASLLGTAEAARALFPTHPQLLELYLQACASAGQDPATLVSDTLDALDEVYAAHGETLASTTTFTPEHKALCASVHRLWRAILNLALYGDNGRPALHGSDRSTLFARVAGSLPDGGAECIIFNWAVATSSSIAAVRKTYNALLKNTIDVPRALVIAIIDFESNVPAPSLDVLNPLHDAVTAKYGATSGAASLWLGWVKSLLTTAADPSRVSAIYQRAVSALDGNNDEMEAFTMGYTNLVKHTR